jgi:hypothetical protein
MIHVMTDAPAGLPPATAHYRQPLLATARTGALLAGLLLVVCAAKGAWPPPPFAWVLIVFFASWLMLKQVRTELMAGPGWFSTQGLLRRRHVRTDQLKRVTCGRSGIDRIIILTDRDGRRVGVLLNRLQHNPELRQRIAADVRVSVRGGLVVPERCARLLGV